MVLAVLLIQETPIVTWNRGNNNKRGNPNVDKTTLVTMDEWLDATRQATKETVSTMLKLDVTPLTSIDTAHEPLSGAHISLKSSNDNIEICLVTSKEGCGKLARAMLSMDETDPLDDADVDDAVGEILNVIAGAVKRQLNHKTQNTLLLGLPKHIKGHVSPCNTADKRETDTLLGVTPSKLLVFKMS